MASLLTHLKVQRHSFVKVALYGVEGAVLCLIGAWLFGKMDVAGMLIVSAIFGLVIFLIGAMGILRISYNTMREAETEVAKEEN